MTATGRRPHLLVLSADTPDALEGATDDLAGKLTPDSDLGLLADQLRGLPELSHRRAVVAIDPERAARGLSRREPKSVVRGQARPGRPVVFLFAGVGDQYPGLGAGLARALPGYRRELTHCLHEMSDEAGVDLPEVLFPEDPVHRRGRTLAEMLGQAHHPVADIHRTAAAQPLLFATQYAMASTLRRLGLEPDVLAGYSIGEYVAACVAGVLPLDGALQLVARRARLVADLPDGGGMLAVAAAPGDLGDLGPDVCVAALNSPALTVLSGPVKALTAIALSLADRNVSSQQLSTSHAFHSPMMEPVVEPLRQLVAGLDLREPRIRMLCNGTGGWMGAEATDAGYWAGHLRNTVRFADNAALLWTLPDPVLVELGPGPTLGRLAGQSTQRPPGAGLIVSTAPGPMEKRPDLVAFLTALAQLWTAGCSVSLTALAAVEQG
jgi:acyl transferase domain-containing protein